MTDGFKAEKNQEASKAFTAFLTSPVFAKHLKPGHVLPLFLCLVLQQSTPFRHK